MANISNRFKSYVMSFSYKERRVKNLADYKKRVRELENMERDELNFEYINLKAECEHKKSVLTVFIILIVLAMLMNIWERFFSFIEKALTYAASVQENGIEIAKISFVTSAMLAIALTVIILYILLNYMKDIKQMQKELMMIEEVRNK